MMLIALLDLEVETYPCTVIFSQSALGGNETNDKEELIHNRIHSFQKSLLDKMCIF